MTKSNYTPGLQTKEKILTSAKKLFYLNGFNKTSMKDIASDAGIRQSLLYYYFNNKNKIATEIYTNFNRAHDNLIVDEIKRRNINISKTIERSVYVASYFRLCLLKPNLAAFIAEVDEIELQYKDVFIYNAYRAIIDDNPSALNETPYEFIIIQNIGINTLMFRLFTTNQIKATVDEIVRFKVTHLLKSLSIEKRKIYELVEEVFKLEKEIQVELIDFFEVKLK